MFQDQVDTSCPTTTNEDTTTVSKVKNTEGFCKT